MCFYYFLFDLHSNHPSLGKDRYNFPKEKQEQFIVKTVKILQVTHQYILWFQRGKHIVCARNSITVDSRLILLLGFPKASIISRAYKSLWALFIRRRSFQLKPSLPLKDKKSQKTTNTIICNADLSKKCTERIFSDIDKLFWF